jgi:hypothetical protein
MLWLFFVHFCGKLIKRVGIRKRHATRRSGYNAVFIANFNSIEP